MFFVGCRKSEILLPAKETQDIYVPKIIATAAAPKYKKTGFIYWQPHKLGTKREAPPTYYSWTRTGAWLVTWDSKHWSTERNSRSRSTGNQGNSRGGRRRRRRREELPYRHASPIQFTTVVECPVQQWIISISLWLCLCRWFQWSYSSEKGVPWC